MDTKRTLIDKVEHVHIDTVRVYPGNPRKGNVALIEESLRENKQFTPLVVQRSTGHILAGNHTWEAAKRLGWNNIDVIYVDVDNNAARKIMLASNRTSDVARYDQEALAACLQAVDDFSGTGWTPEDLDDLLEATKTLPVLPPAPVYNSYSETTEQTQERLQHFADAAPRVAYGVREAVLILPQEKYDVLLGLIQNSKVHAGEDLTNGEAVLMGMRAALYAVKACDSDDPWTCRCPWHKAVDETVQEKKD